MTAVASWADRWHADQLIDAYEAAHWSTVRAAWLESWSTGRCMACGTRRRRREVHHGRYPLAWIAGAWRPARGAGERAVDLYELCTKCHRTGPLAGHDRFTPDLAERTRRHIRRTRRRNWWRRPPTPIWTWSAT
jgi:hypothetical protein